MTVINDGFFHDVPHNKAYHLPIPDGSRFCSVVDTTQEPAPKAKPMELCLADMSKIQVVPKQQFLRDLQAELEGQLRTAIGKKADQAIEAVSKKFAASREATQRLTGTFPSGPPKPGTLLMTLPFSTNGHPAGTLNIYSGKAPETPEVAPPPCSPPYPSQLLPLFVPKDAEVGPPPCSPPRPLPSSAPVSREDCPAELKDLDHTIVKFLVDRLNAFRNLACRPIDLDDHKLDEIIEAFEIITDQGVDYFLSDDEERRVQKAFKKLGKIFFDLYIA